MSEELNPRVFDTVLRCSTVKASTRLLIRAAATPQGAQVDNLGGLEWVSNRNRVRNTRREWIVSRVAWGGGTPYAAVTSYKLILI